MGLDLLIPPRRNGADESIASFLRRRFGQECVDLLGEPLLAGIHSGDPERLSIQATFPRFVELERRHGSLVRGLLSAPRPRWRPGAPPPPAFYSLAGGLGELVEALAARLPADRVWTACPVREIARDSEGWQVRSEGGSLAARAVIVAVPAPLAASLLEPLAPDACAPLRSVRFASTATVLLGYRREDVAHPLDGYGMVIPRTEGLRTTALSFVSTKFPGRAPERRVLLRGFLGGAREPEVLSLDDAAMAALVHREMAPVLGLRGEPVLRRVFRWPGGTPQMEVGHLDKVAAVECAVAAVPGLHLTGAGLRVTGVPDCVADGTRTAEAAAVAAQLAR
jgi:oxygen-dependent protoporphyrinogen oxidase